jgi:hypothetical protein
MAFISILFGEDEFNVQPEPQVPSCFRDLNLDQVVNAVVTGRQTYDLKPFFYTPLRRVDAILFRHAIWRDLEDQELLEGLRAFAQRMVVMHRYLNLAHKLAYPIHRQGWFLEAAVSYCEAVAALNRDLARADVRSRGLLAFRASLRDYEDSADFGAWRDDATRLQSILSSLAYCIHIKGRTVQVSKYAQEADYSAEITQTFAKFKQGDVKDYRTTLRAASGMDHVQAQILDRVARLYPDAFAALDQFCSSRATFCDPGCPFRARDPILYRLSGFHRRTPADGPAVLLSRDHPGKGRVRPRGLRHRPGQPARGRQGACRPQ